MDNIYFPQFIVPPKPNKKAEYLTNTIMSCYDFKIPEMPCFDNLIWYRWENVKKMQSKVYENDKLIHDYRFFKDKDNYIYCVDKVENKQWYDPKHKFKVIDNYFVIQEDK